MGKQLTINTGNSRLASLMIAVLIIAGIGLLLWAIIVLLSERTNALNEFALSAVLGIGLIGIGLFTFRGQLAERRVTAWLEQHGTWIIAVPFDIRPIKTDSVRRTESYCLLLKPTDSDKERHGLDGLTFETDEIFARSVPEDYQNLKIDVVIDPDKPGEVHFVSFNPQDLWSARH